MRLLFLGLNYAPEEIGIGLYSGEMLRCWADEGHQAQVVAAKPYYPQWRVWPGFGGLWRRSVEHGVEVTRCPLYVPAHPTGLRRIIHHVSFAVSSLLPMMRGAGKRPDLVMTTAPSLIAAPVALLAAKLGGARSWLHIQDFEVEAAAATGLVDGSGLGARLARGFERWVLQSFDVVSSISPQMCARLLEKGVQPDRVFQLRIELVIEAARLLQARDDLTFVICGEGPNRARLEAEAAALPNVRLHDLQPRERLGELLGMATVHLLPQLAGAADLVLPSKLTNMLASGRPVVATADPGTGLADEVDGVGMVTPPGDAAAFADAIARLVDDPERAARLGKAARERAEQRWSRKAILQGFIEKSGKILK